MLMLMQLLIKFFREWVKYYYDWLVVVGANCVYFLSLEPRIL